MSNRKDVYWLHEKLVTAWRSRIASRISKSRKEGKRVSQNQIFQTRVLLRSQLLGTNSRLDIGPNASTKAASEFLVGWRLPLLHKLSLIPGFRPDVYRVKKRLPKRFDPTVNYLLEGMPAGPWQLNVVRGKPATGAKRSTSSIGVHVHAHYVPELREILSRVRAFAGRQVIVYITTTLPAGAQQKVQLALGSELKMRWFPVENRGRDITPLARELPDSFWSHDVIFHLHTKHSSKNLDYQLWFEFLLDALLGNASIDEDLFNPIVRQFVSNPKLGIVLPSDPNILGWGLNYLHARRLVGWQTRLPGPTKEFVFPIGTMFAARPGAMRTWLEVAAKAKPPPEPVARDGTFLHALERLIVILAEQDGYETAVSWPGLSRR